MIINFLHKPIVYGAELQLSGTETSYTVVMFPQEWKNINTNTRDIFQFPNSYLL